MIWKRYGLFPPPVLKGRIYLSRAIRKEKIEDIESFKKYFQKLVESKEWIDMWYEYTQKKVKKMNLTPKQREILEGALLKVRLRIVESEKIIEKASEMLNGRH